MRVSDFQLGSYSDFLWEEKPALQVIHCDWSLLLAKYEENNSKSGNHHGGEVTQSPWWQKRPPHQFLAWGWNTLFSWMTVSRAATSHSTTHWPTMDDSKCRGLLLSCEQSWIVKGSQVLTYEVCLWPMLYRQIWVKKKCCKSDFWLDWYLSHLLMYTK